MPRFQVAHLHEQGQDMIIVPLDSDFKYKQANVQHDAIADIQSHARAAGLRGTVVPVWDSGGGRMAFIAPKPWHPFFRSMSLRVVASNLNREIYW
jgi:hypothetical protein